MANSYLNCHFLFSYIKYLNVLSIKYLKIHQGPAANNFQLKMQICSYVFLSLGGPYNSDLF